MPISLAENIAIEIDPARLAALAGLSLDPWQADVMRSTGPRLILNCHRQSGKSTVVALKALWTALYDRSLVLLLSPSLRQSRELFKKVTAVFELLGRPVLPNASSQLELELSTGGRIVSLPSSEATVRGFSGPRLIVMDEASRIPSALFEAIIPMQSVSGGALIMLSTPWGKRGFFYEAWAGMKGHWNRIERLATDCPRITQERLIEAQQLMDQDKFQREYMCKFTEAPGQYFSEQSLERAFRIGNRDTESGDPYGSLSYLFSDPLRPARRVNDPDRITPGPDALAGSLAGSNWPTDSDSPGQFPDDPETSGFTPRAGFNPDGFTDEELASQAVLELGGGL